MRTHLEFTADRFVSDGEDEANSINPDIRGGKLAEFLSAEFAERGYTGGVLEEDWGWMVQLGSDPFPTWVGCASYGEDSWLVFIEPSKPTIRRWFKKFDTTLEVEKIASLLEEIVVSNGGATNLKWWSDRDSGRK